MCQSSLLANVSVVLLASICSGSGPQGGRVEHAVRTGVESQTADQRSEKPEEGRLRQKGGQ